MRAKNGVKRDPSRWFDLLSSYQLTSLPHDTVLRGVLREDLSPHHPDVVEVVADWPTPVHFENGADGTDVVLVYQMKESPPESPVLHALLFAATLVTTLGSGALMRGADPFSTRFVDFGVATLPYPSSVDVRQLWLGASFALPFLAVLMVHEMGHVFAARAHRVRASLPYFIPFPPYFSLIGTLGAFIRLRGPTVRRSSLFDIGVGGPLASFLLSLPLFVVGLSWSAAVPLESDPWTPFAIYFAGQPVLLGSGALTKVLLVTFDLGGGSDSVILLHPLALAGWLGLFVTALNLLPLGQLDGGHILFALFPERQALIARGFLFSLVPLGALWWGWWAWVALVVALHRGRIGHPKVILPEPAMDRGRRVVGWFVILIFLVTFAPVPLRM